MSGVKKKNQLPRVEFSKDKLVVYDAIAGDHFGKYDDMVLYFGSPEVGIIKTLRYIRLVYKYSFTKGYIIPRFEKKPLTNRIKMAYDPLNPEQYYTYNEICKQFKLVPTIGSNISNGVIVLSIGNNYGLIEYLSQTKLKYKNATYVVTNYYDDIPENAVHNIQEDMYNKNIEANIITELTSIYNVLDSKADIRPADIYAYDNINYVKHFELMFAHTHTISNIIGIISGLKYTKTGGTFIIHMQSIINKTNADLYLLAKQYFDSAKLYMPECWNKYKHSGTWAIFTGFRGIPEAEFKNLLDIVKQIKAHYPNGIHDSQVYDQKILKLCWRDGKYFSTTPKHIPYISGFFDYKLDDTIYREIIAFNNHIYAEKLAFSKQIKHAMQTIKYPEHYNIPTNSQVASSIQYLQKWNIKYTLSKSSSHKNGKKGSIAKPYTYLFISDSISTDKIDEMFTARGNWKPYTDKTYKTPVDFFYIDGKYINNTEYYKIKSNLKSLVGDSKHAIVYKDNLYKNLSRIPGTRKFLPVTVPFSIRDTEPKYLDRFRTYFKPGKPYICKVIKGGSGKGIVTTDKFSVFLDFMRVYYNRMRSSPATFKQYDWVLQEYIANPWLVDGKKMHLRQIMIYQPAKDKPSYYMYMGEFALAEKPYVRGNWENKEIHDTHFHNGIGYAWPFDMNFTMEQWQKVKVQFDYIYSCILNIMKDQGECYSDSKNCFELFGLDFMITDDLRVVLIEVNARVGLSPSEQFVTSIFNSVLAYIVDDYFPPRYEQPNYLTYFPIKPLDGKLSSKLISNKTRKRANLFLL